MCAKCNEAKTKEEVIKKLLQEMYKEISSDTDSVRLDSLVRSYDLLTRCN